jgi:hypothetical protein
LGGLLFAFLLLVLAMDVAQEALHGILVFSGGIMVCTLEFRVADVAGTVFAPVAGRRFPKVGHFVGVLFVVV